jgi:hypothetical protein
MRPMTTGLLSPVCLETLRMAISPASLARLLGSGSPQ